MKHITIILALLASSFWAHTQPLTPFTTNWGPITDSTGVQLARLFEANWNNQVPDFANGLTGYKCCQALADKIQQTEKLFQKPTAENVLYMLANSVVVDVSFLANELLNHGVSQGIIVSKLVTVPITGKFLVFSADGQTKAPIALVKLFGTNGPCFNIVGDLRPIQNQTVVTTTAPPATNLVQVMVYVPTERAEPKNPDLLTVEQPVVTETRYVVQGQSCGGCGYAPQMRSGVNLGIGVALNYSQPNVHQHVYTPPTQVIPSGSPGAGSGSSGSPGGASGSFPSTGGGQGGAGNGSGG